ncbi:MAG: hypothetical protein WD894_20955 [Pirellulales bacterium]
MTRATSVDDHKLAAAYESLREVLAASKYADRKDKPLAFWALPGDRRLPMALLGYSLKELLSRSLEELSATPGIGKKKLSSLIKLLHRATKDHPPVVLFTDETAGKTKAAKSRGGRGGPSSRSGFDPATVSELLWEQWRQTIRRYGLEHETLGRLAPSLDRLPTVIWRTPLDTYLDSTIADIRGLKTHGEKRLRAILEVFHSIHETLGQVPRQGHLRVDVRPNFTAPVERWVHEVVGRSQPPSPAELKQRVILPILEQLRIDAGAEIFRILEERLGIKGSPVPVQQQAKRLGVTRARVYQLLEMCADVMSVRWPEGEKLFLRLHHKLGSFPNAKTQVARLRALTDLIYPELRDTPAAPPERSLEANHAKQNSPRTEGSPSRQSASHQHQRNKNGAPVRLAAAR